MRCLIIVLLMLIAAPAPATAQSYPAPAFNPAADYITAGQDEPGYQRWYASAAATAVASLTRAIAAIGATVVGAG